MVALLVDAVLFDLDGTLVDSTASVLRNWRKVATLMGRPGEDLVGDLHGMPGRQTLRLRAPELSDEHVDELNRVLIEGEIFDTSDVVATAGAAALLGRIPPDRWGIVTSAPLRLAVARITAAGLPMPQTLITADDVAVGKPDPEPFRLGAQRLSRLATKCLAVEDAPVGISSARAAGCQVLGVLTTYATLDAHTVPDLRSLAVELTADGLRVRF